MRYAKVNMRFIIVIIIIFWARKCEMIVKQVKKIVSIILGDVDLFNSLLDGGDNKKLSIYSK